MGLFDDFLMTEQEDKIKNSFYDNVHFAFGLPNRGVTQAPGGKFKNPIKATWHTGTIKSFEINGTQLAVSLFLAKGWSNVFTRIQRDSPSRRGYAYAYDISKLHEGQLKGKQVRLESSELIESNERLEILDIIGSSVLSRHLVPPLVYLGFGPLWQERSTPDRVYIQFSGMRQMPDYDIRNLSEAIYYRYGIQNNLDIEVSNIFDHDYSVLDINFSKKPEEPPVEPQQVPTITPENAPVDTFPYDYYQSIGWIDEYGLIPVETSVGIIRIPARSEEGRTYLLKLGQQ